MKSETFTPFDVARPLVCGWFSGRRKERERTKVKVKSQSLHPTKQFSIYVGRSLGLSVVIITAVTAVVINEIFFKLERAAGQAQYVASHHFV